MNYDIDTVKFYTSLFNDILARATNENDEELTSMINYHSFVTDENGEMLCPHCYFNHINPDNQISEEDFYFILRHGFKTALTFMSHQNKSFEDALAEEASKE